MLKNLCLIVLERQKPDLFIVAPQKLEALPQIRKMLAGFILDAGLQNTDTLPTLIV